jgi:hypothetical protein
MIKITTHALNVKTKGGYGILRISFTNVKLESTKKARNTFTRKVTQ